MRRKLTRAPPSGFIRSFDEANEILKGGQPEPLLLNELLTMNVYQLAIRLFYAYLPASGCRSAEFDLVRDGVRKHNCLERSVCR